jgi:pilus assembly protein Flp/PilA
MKQLVVRFVREDAGQDLIEYVLLASFIAAAVIAGATALGTNLNAWYQAVGTWAGNQAGSFGS